MYLSEVNIWNFRKYGIRGESFDTAEPGLSVRLQPGLNLLIGENDSGKTTIVDAIRYTLGTQSGDWIHLDESDFHSDGEHRAEELRIECVFRDLSPEEAGLFLEWLGTETVDDNPGFSLKVRLTATRRAHGISPRFTAGADPEGQRIDGDARALLRVTYLKPLRDADAELTPGRRSRLAQILKAHSVFQHSDSEHHELEEIVSVANSAIEDYFRDRDDGVGACVLVRRLATYLNEFLSASDDRKPRFAISGGELTDILRRLSLSFDDNPAGLGAANLLFMATELLLLQSPEKCGLRLALVEELEAHLHPQAQLRLIRYLQGKSQEGQFILTSHSTTLGSSIALQHLIICKGNEVFPMGSEFTRLHPKDYGFLERFLDATKANLFFAQGVLLVEGAAENLLIPTLAKAIDRPLHRYGVSIVNVGGTAFSHYAKIFSRRDGSPMGIRVAVVTDMDVRPLEWYDDNGDGDSVTAKTIEEERSCRKQQIVNMQTTEVKAYVSPNWTLEYEITLADDFREGFYRAVLRAQKITNSRTGAPQPGKLDEADAQVLEDFQTWSTTWGEDCRAREKVAYEICQHRMFDKRISKAVTAQTFADILRERMVHDGASLRFALEKAPSLRYLVDAIYHVTEPKETSDED